MTALSLIAGAALLALVALDVWLTVLHPTWRGPLSSTVIRAVWRLMRAMAGWTRREGPLLVAAPVAMACQFVSWLLCVWVGFALLYLPWIDSFAYATAIDFGERGLLEALYVSGTCATTVGLGDVVAGTDALRLLTVLEAASGFAVFTAAITYLLSVIPLVSDMRVAARGAAARTPDEAMRLAIAGGSSELGEVLRGVLRADQHLKRFPILFFFHPRRSSESTLALVHGAALVCALLRWGLRAEGSRPAAFYGPRLESALDEFMSDHADRFLRGHGAPPEPVSDEHLARALHSAAGSEAADDPPVGLADFLRRVDAFLAAVAVEHRYEPRLLRDSLSA